MDRHAGRTVLDEADGYALIEARRDNHPRVGDPAPDFELSRADVADPTPGPPVRLSSFAGSRPVVLIFGSLT